MSEQGAAAPQPLQLLGDPDAVACVGDACLLPASSTLPQETSAG